LGEDFKKMRRALELTMDGDGDGDEELEML
jgi:hypothetical protein